jgi:Fe(3+) dicitrate transport protein
VTGNNINASAILALPAQGRFTNARKYWIYGVEPRFHATYKLLGFNNEADFGGRVMYEQSERKQFLNVSSGIGQTCPSTQTGCLGEDNLRNTTAYALFFQNRFFLSDQLIITPGFRVESVNYDQQNRLAQSGNGQFAKTWIAEVLPGIGITYAPVKNYTVFAGFHRGFGPPQISDAVQSDRVVDLDAELSWNYELGVRGTPTYWAGFELTGFRMDFTNQIISQSVAGGSGATNTNAGRTAHTGLEAATKLDLFDMVTGRNREQDIIFDVNYTWVIQAEFRGSRNSNIQGAALLAGESSSFSTGGKRLPYSPEHLLTAGLSYINRPFGFDGRVETQCISDQFGDDRNTVIPTPNGQRGLIPGWCMFNAAGNQYVKKLNTTFYVTGKNIFNQLFIVDRSRGIYAGLPALIQAGAKWTF